MPETAPGGEDLWGGGGELQSCLRDMQYIQPHFESFVTPRRRYVCLVRPLALVLAVKAGDARLDASIRRRAEHALASMSEAKDVFAAGLAGDYGEVCLEFLRGFDVHDHDPATTGREVEDFTRGLRRLFVDGHVVRVPAGADSVSTPGSASTPAAQEPRQKTLTQIALAAVRDLVVVSHCRTAAVQGHSGAAASTSPTWAATARTRCDRCIRWHLRRHS